MDTSSWKEVERIQGRDAVRVKDIPPDALLYLVEDLYKEPHIAGLADLYKSIASRLSGREAIYGTIPRGITVFDKGIGINTQVCSVQSSECLSGQQLFPDSPGLWSCEDQELLLLVPQKDVDTQKRLRPKWALWSRQFAHTKLHHVPKDGMRWSTTATKSEVKWLSEAAVIDILRKEPSLAHYFIERVRTAAMLHAEELVKKAHRLHRLSFKAEAMLGHMSNS